MTQWLEILAWSALAAGVVVVVLALVSRHDD
jgi:hypothetical protein